MYSCSPEKNATFRILSALKKCFFSLYANLSHKLWKDLLQGASNKLWQTKGQKTTCMWKNGVGGKQNYQTFAINLA